MFQKYRPIKTEFFQEAPHYRTAMDRLSQETLRFVADRVKRAQQPPITTLASWKYMTQWRNVPPYLPNIGSCQRLLAFPLGLIQHSMNLRILSQCRSTLVSFSNEIAVLNHKPPVFVVPHVTGYILIVAGYCSSPAIVCTPVTSPWRSVISLTTKCVIVDLIRTVCGLNTVLLLLMFSPWVSL